MPGPPAPANDNQRTARAANRPDFRLAVDGVDFTGKARPRLVSLRLREERGGEADQLDLVLDDSDGKLALPPKGASVALSLGWASGTDVTVGLVDKGRFVVDEVSWAGPPDQVTIRARSADLTSRFRTRREKGWTDTTLGTVANDVAGANGLTAKVAPELASTPVPVLAQHQTSDAALLRRLGRDHDAVATVKDGNLLLTPVGRGTTPGGRPIPGLTIVRASGDRYSYREVDRQDGAGVEARWHDRDKAKRKTVKVGGRRKAGEAKATPHRLARVYHTEDDAKAAAKAENGRRARREAEFDLTLALGRPDLYVERVTVVSGFKPQVDAKRWLLASLEHSLDQSGLKTSVKLETAAKPAA